MFFPFHDDNPTVRRPVVTVALIAINTVVWLATWLQPPGEQQLLALQRGFVPARLTQAMQGEPLTLPVEVVRLHPVTLQPVVQQGELPLSTNPGQVALTTLTCMFMHGGWLHLLGNMWFLWLFGNNVEDRLGPALYLGLYLAGGLLGTAAHWLLEMNSPVPVVGASGAVSAVLGAYAITWPWARVRTLVFLFIFITIVELPALIVLGGWFALQLLEATRAVNINEMGGVAWGAHVGGFLAGMALMVPLRAMVAPLARPFRAEVIERDPWRRPPSDRFGGI